MKQYGTFRHFKQTSFNNSLQWHNDVIMGTMASQITSRMIVYSTVIQAQIKENIKAPHHWPLCGEFTGSGEFPAQRASNAENVSISWRHRVLLYHSIVISEGVLSVQKYQSTHHNRANWSIVEVVWWLCMMTSSILALRAGKSLVIGDFPAQRPVVRSFDVFFDLRLNKRLHKQSWGWWFETPSRSLWRHCIVWGWGGVCVCVIWFIWIKYIGILSLSVK